MISIIKNFIKRLRSSTAQPVAEPVATKPEPVVTPVAEPVVTKPEPVVVTKPEPVATPKAKKTRKKKAV